MKHSVCIPLLLVHIICSAQKIELYYDYTWHQTEDVGRARYYTLIEKKDTLWNRKDYYLKERRLQMQGDYQDKDTKIEQGIFQYYYPNGVLSSVGAYSNGKKTGVWLGYHDNGFMKDSMMYESGNIIGTRMGWHNNGFFSDSSIYENDGSGLTIEWFHTGIPSDAGRFSAGRKRNGKWQFFHSNGQLSSVEVYLTGQLISRQYFNESGDAMNDTTNTDRDATFPGGAPAWKKYLEKNLYFPSQYKITGSDQVIVVVDWVIDTDGSVQQVKVSAPFHPDFDKIAASVIQKSPKWIAAVSHNRKIKFYMQQPVTFAQ